MTREWKRRGGVVRRHAFRMARFAAVAVFAAPALGAFAAERVALVVGNAAYEHTTALANPANDARDMAALLRRLGFDVVTATDLDREGLFDQIGVFEERARNAAVSLFFYAGHGLQVDGANYLVPVDARLERKLDVRRRAVELGDVMDAMGGGINLVFLDACRNNPLAVPLARSMGLSRDAAATRGLAPMRRAVETLVAYATDPGAVAADGTGRNSPFTAALLEHLDTPGLSINDLLTRVKRSVRERTGDRQRPWTHDSLSSIFYLLPGSGSPVEPSVSGSAPGAPDPVAEMWKVVRDSGDRALVEDFLSRHPGSGYEGAARALLRRLSAQPFTVETEPPGAAVRVVDVAEAYRAGMALPPGEYQVEARLDGHETVVETVRHGAGRPTRHRLVLPRAGPRWAAGERFRDCEDCPEMVVVPAGRFRMGCVSGRDCQDDEKPVREVRIGKPFALGRYEVTVGEFSRFVDATGHSVGGSCWASDGGEWKKRAGRNWRSPGFRQGRDHPVVCLSWHDARKYASWLSRKTGEAYRLPSESEWEYAARAGTTTTYHFGNDPAALCRYGNHADWHNASCSDGVGEMTAPAGSFAANAFGLQDVHGNAWEWVEDCWHASYAGAPVDGGAWSGDCARPVLRGGSWDTDPSLLRAARRVGEANGNRMNSVGFRVARYRSKGAPRRSRDGRHGATRHPLVLQPAGPRWAAGESFTDCAGCPEMVVVPAGRFRMGCVSGRDCQDDEKPVREVRIGKPFALGRYEVTVGEFSRFVDATGHSVGGSCRTAEGGEIKDRVGRSWSSPGFSQGRDHPVVCVNWSDAGAYASWLSRETGEAYRLPSESEWEYAARAGATTAYHFGNDVAALCRYDNHGDLSTTVGGRNAFCSDGVGLMTAPVGSFGANAFSLHDVHGNVWEWVEDCSNSGYAGAPVDGSAWLSGDCAKRGARGGSFAHGPSYSRAALRGSAIHGSATRVFSIGFRVARTITMEAPVVIGSQIATDGD